MKKIVMLLLVGIFLTVSATPALSAPPRKSSPTSRAPISFDGIVRAVLSSFRVKEKVIKASFLQIVEKNSCQLQALKCVFRQGNNCAQVYHKCQK